MFQLRLRMNERVRSGKALARMDAAPRKKEEERERETAWVINLNTCSQFPADVSLSTTRDASGTYRLTDTHTHAAVFDVRRGALVLLTTENWINVMRSRRGDAGENGTSTLQVLSNLSNTSRTVNRSSTNSISFDY